ncbi:MAG: hypothetical protein AMJ54_01720 [Deltaproteobacteria bacterium SG8_13]|nr:MAG: hypothetical protein AMJ54_01720 [Deltaproteobacteria bacterium SG8_13]
MPGFRHHCGADFLSRDVRSLVAEMAVAVARQVVVIAGDPEEDFHTFENPASHYWAINCPFAGMLVFQKGLDQRTAVGCRSGQKQRVMDARPAETVLREPQQDVRQQKKTRPQAAAGF